jgi:catechol 2,3-dioxygenase-like lactoylglutathione lyase family enzyme
MESECHDTITCACCLQVTDLEGSLRHASEVLGMRVVERVDGRAYLTLGSQHNTYGGAHHVIEYFEGPVTALEHVAFRAANAEALEHLCQRLQKAAVAVWAGELEPGITGAIRFKSPCGHEFEVFSGYDTIRKRPIRELEFGCDESSTSILTHPISIQCPSS